MNAAATAVATKTNDPLGEWLQMGREVLEMYYPGTLYAVLVAEQGGGLPAVSLPVILPDAASRPGDVLPFAPRPASSPSPAPPRA